jgi:hypothetical protein
MSSHDLKAAEEYMIHQPELFYKLYHQSEQS